MSIHETNDNVCNKTCLCILNKSRNNENEFVLYHAVDTCIRKRISHHCTNKAQVVDSYIWRMKLFCDLHVYTMEAYKIL